MRGVRWTKGRYLPGFDRYWSRHRHFTAVATLVGKFQERQPNSAPGKGLLYQFVRFKSSAGTAPKPSKEMRVVSRTPRAPSRAAHLPWVPTSLRA